MARSADDASSPDTARAWRLAKSRPAEALELANSLLVELTPSAPGHDRALAARGRAHYELGDNDRALSDLRSALVSSTGPFRKRVAIALAAAEFAGGDSSTSERLLVEIIETDDGTDQTETAAALARSQLGLFRLHVGRTAEAASLLEASIDPLARAADERDAAGRVIANAGTCHLLLGNLERAVELMDQAIEIGRSTDQDFFVAGCLQNKAYCLSQLGDFPAALEQLDQARALYELTGDPGRNLSTFYDDCAETYRLAGLTSDAVEQAVLALRSVEGGGNIEKIADATYRLALCLLDHGDHERAIEIAEQARLLFHRAGRSLWETRATLIALEGASAELAGTEELRARAERAQRAAEELAGSGWHTEALRLRNRMALIGLALDDPSLVGRFLIERPAEGDQSVVGRLEQLLHHTIAGLHHEGRGGPALTEAWATLQAHRLRLADPELRAGAGRLADAFRFAALTEATASEDPTVILAAEERWRAASLRLPRARPSKDPEVASTAQRLREATRAARDVDSPDLELDRRVRHLEERLRRASHQASSVDVDADPDRVLDGPVLVSSLVEQLGDRRLVEWFDHRGQLHGISVDADGVALWEVGPLTELRSLAERIRRELARLLHAPGAGGAGPRWARLIVLANQLRRPLFAHPNSPSRPGGLVLCPPGPLQELPWALLVPGRGTPTTVCYTATAWLDRPSRMVPEPVLSFVAGPGLANDQQDHRVAVARFPTTEVFPRADRQALARAIETTDLLHVAAHGRFRPASPMFSSLRLADGDFALHELADFDRLPSVVALAACDAGRSLHLDHGDEQIGTAPAWLGAGVETVIAPICAVPDATTAEVFNRFYDALPGRTPAQALALAWAAVADGEPEVAGTAAALLCFGGGGPTIGRSGPDRPAGSAQPVIDLRADGEPLAGSLRGRPDGPTGGDLDGEGGDIDPRS